MRTYADAPGSWCCRNRGRNKTCSCPLIGRGDAGSPTSSRTMPARGHSADSARTFRFCGSIADAPGPWMWTGCGHGHSAGSAAAMDSLLLCRGRGCDADTSKSRSIPWPPQCALAHPLRGHSARAPRLVRGRKNLTKVRGRACPVLNGIPMMAGLRLRLTDFLCPSAEFRDAFLDARQPFDDAALGQAKMTFLRTFRCALASLIAVSGVNGLAQGIQNTDGSGDFALGGLNHDILHSDSNTA